MTKKPATIFNFGKSRKKPSFSTAVSVGESLMKYRNTLSPLDSKAKAIDSMVADIAFQIQTKPEQFDYSLTKAESDRNERIKGFQKKMKLWLEKQKKKLEK